MSVPRPIELRVQIRRSQTAADSHIVFGEVMVPSPEGIEPGSVLRRSDLAEWAHFDGAFMRQADVVMLADRFARKRPSVDVEHDGIPRSATVVRSWIAGETGEDPGPWTRGAWVVGVDVHDEALRARCHSDGDDALRAFSIQCMVRAREIPVVVVDGDGDGEVRSAAVLTEFSRPDPQYLSLVKDPATGRKWKKVARAARIVDDLPIDASVEWDPAGAAARLLEWQRLHDAEDGVGFACVTDSGLSMPIADVIDGEPRLVLRAVQAARAHVEGRDDAVSKRIRDNLNKIEEKAVSDKNAPSDRGSLFRSIVRGIGALVGVDASEADAVADAEATAGSSDGAETTTTYRGVAQIVAGQEIADKLWGYHSALMQAFYAIMEDEDVEDKAAAMRSEIADYAAMLTAMVDELGAEQVAERAKVDLEAQRAGKKMAKSRLDKLKAAFAQLSELLAELDDGEGEGDGGEEASRSTEEGADDGAADEGAADEGAADEGAADEGAADEGAADEGAADEGAADEGAEGADETEALRRRTAELEAELKRYRGQHRPLPSGGGAEAGERTTPHTTDAHSIVRGALFPRD